jgi:hypothetical protein
MSGFSLLFENSVDYERTHQLVLYILLKYTDLARHLLTETDSLIAEEEIKDVIWEPERKLFDLCVVTSRIKHYFEFKVWSQLSNSQLERQTEFLDGTKTKGYYILLGTSWFEYSNDKIKKQTDKKSSKIGYEKLIHALSAVLANPNTSFDACELALFYRNVLSSHYYKFTDGYLQENHDKIFYYSLYWQIQNRISKLSTSIFTVNNPGGPVYILNNDNYRNITVHSTEVKLYYEMVDGKFRIKFYAETENKDIKYMIQNNLRLAVHSVLDSKYKIIDIGKIGQYMTACEINDNYANQEAIKKAADTFIKLEASMDNIAQELRNHF